MFTRFGIERKAFQIGILGIVAAGNYDSLWIVVQKLLEERRKVNGKKTVPRPGL